VACRANRGELLAPGGVLYEDGLWRLEHTFEPFPMIGWLVLKPQRHVEAVADLTPEEASALGPLLQRITRAMSDVLAPAKVYVALYAEAVSHIHFHLIPRAGDLPEALRGPAVFALLEEAARTGENRADGATAERVALAVKARLGA
jgi:diadenosine tetraphosphate (Ap4A) HIT family hydrolase